MTLFQELILISLGKQERFSRTLTDKDWGELYALARKHTLTGVLLRGVETVIANRPVGADLPPVLYQWMGLGMALEQENEKLNRYSAKLTKILSDAGFRSCVLKGQGTARLYPDPSKRNCGDIDMWVEGKRDVILDFMMKNFSASKTVIHHTDVKIFENVETEIHFLPSFSYNPIRHWKYLKFFEREGDEQFCHFDEELGFAYPANRFNAVFSLLHIFRHVFHEGIGLRQMMDYYYIVRSLDLEDRKWVRRMIGWLGLSRFAGAVMYVMAYYFDAFPVDGNASEGQWQKTWPWLLCKPEIDAGRFLLAEIERGGNFGKHDSRVKKAHSGGSVKLYLANVRRLFNMLRFYPSEVLCAPIWKPSHWLWRKWKGYA